MRRPPVSFWKRELTCGAPLCSQVQCQATGSRSMLPTTGRGAHGVVGHLAREIEGVVGDEHHVVVAVDGAEQRRIVLLALARIGARLEVLVARRCGRRISSPKRSNALVVAASAGSGPSSTSMSRHLRETRYCTSASMLMARLGSVCTISRAHSSRRSESSGAVTLNSSTSRPLTAAASGLNASAGASMRKKWMPRSVIACVTARRDLIGRFHGDALEREIGLEHARERLRPRRCRPARRRRDARGS